MATLEGSAAALAQQFDLERFEPIEDFDLDLTQDWVAFQQLERRHGSILAPDGSEASGKVANSFFGVVLAVGPGKRMDDGSVREVSLAKEGDVVMCDGTMRFYHTPSGRKCFIAPEHVIVGRLKRLPS
jgi:co-chaperonin GroES (HSP10)